MKKVVWFAFVCALIILGAMVFDYLYNDRFHRVEFHTASTREVQNVYEFSAPLVQLDNLCLMQGAVRLGDNITVGAEAIVTVGSRQLEGYLYQIEPGFDGISIATVSVLTPEPLSGEATATIYGTRDQGRMFLPAECMVTDERGNAAVFVEVNGYAILRTVEAEPVASGTEWEVLSGVFAKERVVLSPQRLRTGDRISE